MAGHEKCSESATFADPRFSTLAECRALQKQVLLLVSPFGAGRKGSFLRGGEKGGLDMVWAGTSTLVLNLTALQGDFHRGFCFLMLTSHLFSQLWCCKYVLGLFSPGWFLLHILSALCREVLVKF